MTVHLRRIPFFEMFGYFVSPFGLAYIFGRSAQECVEAELPPLPRNLLHAFGEAGFRLIYMVSARAADII